MGEYINIARVFAKEMTRGEYNKYRGWDVPADENPLDDGYIIENFLKSERIGITWMEKKAFERLHERVR